MTTYYQHVSSLCEKVLEVLAQTLPYGPHVFDDLRRPPIAASMRLLHYPPSSNLKDQLGAGAHTDFGIITLLLTDGKPGLQVLNEATGSWVPVPPAKDAFVVNVGDMLDMITGGEFKSNTHRVVNEGGEDRYSVPYFYDANLDYRLARLDGADEREGRKVPTVEEHMLWRFATTYGRGKEEDKDAV